MFLLLLALLVIAFPLHAQQWVDFTNYLPDPACESLDYWHITEGINGQLRFTQSGRGSSDGSNMNRPFPEYWISSSTGETLNDAEIRHDVVTNLPVGNYRLTLRIRCYDERGYNTPSGAYLYANGVETDVCNGDNIIYLSYNGQPGTYGVFSVEFAVGDDGVLEFGINVRDYNATWVAWKDITLSYDTKSAPPTTLQSGEYYLRNKATGQWLAGGGRWGTQAILADHPMMVYATANGDGTYQLTTEFTNFDAGINGLGVGGSELWVESSSDNYLIENTHDECFTIKGSYGYLGYNGNRAVAFNLTDGKSDYAQWQFVTRRYMLEELLDGTANDATFLISNPRFDRNHNQGDWTVESSNFAINGEDGEYVEGNYCAEVWNTNFDVYQVLANVPNGRYRLTVQGFYRYNNNWGSNTNLYAYNAYYDGTEQLYAYLYANGGGNDVETPLQSIVSERNNIAAMGIYVNQNYNEGYGMPFSMREAANTFTAGLYSGNVLEVDVVNHELTIGLRKSQQDGCDWTIWDNFELTLLKVGDNSDYNLPGEIDDAIHFEEATPNNPVDCTSLIQNADFKSSSGWQGGPKTGGMSEQKVATMGQKEGKNTFDIYQTLTGLPNGMYTLTAQGFYRYGDIDWEQHDDYNWHSDNGNNVWAMYTIPYAIISHREGFERQLAMLYGNNAEKGLPSIFLNSHKEATHSNDFLTDYGWVPNSTRGAAEAFANGEYQVKLMVPVTNGTLRLGVKKQLGYKNDWACWSNVHLYYLGPDNLQYVTDININSSTWRYNSATETLQLGQWEKQLLTATVLPATATDKTVRWQTSDNNIVEVDQEGHVRAKNPGNATLYVYANGSQNGSLRKEIAVTVDSNTGDASQLVINELQVSNLDMFLDPSNNYGAWMEIFNPTTKGISLRDLYVSDDAENPWKFRLSSQSGAVPPLGYAIVWFDHNEACATNVNFKPDMDGGTIWLNDANGNTIDSFTYPKATPRTAYARRDDGDDVWILTDDPSPSSENGHGNAYNLKTERTMAPIISNPQERSSWLWSIDLESEGTVYYTNDCTVPTPENHEGALEPGRDKFVNYGGAGALRFRAYADGKLPSEVIAYTLQEETFWKTKGISLPVLSLTTDPKHLYSDETGIFVTGVNGISGSGLDFPCNWNQDWDRPVYMEYFEGGKRVFAQECNLSRFGGWSRSWYPYNFKLKAQKQYDGNAYFEYPFFQDNKPHLKHKVLQVRNGGNDLNCRIKDAAIQQMIMTSGFYLDCQDYQPVCVYINGKYIGMLNLREPSNKHFGLANYGIDTDEMDQMEVTSWVDVKAGSNESFYQWQNLSYSAYDEETYKQIGEMVDIDEFINYMVAELYLGGDDWPGNNCKVFKGWDGKFHVVFFDVDQALRYDSGSLNRITNNNYPLIHIFRNMLANTKFCKQFIDSYCLFNGSVMQPERCHAIIDRMSEQMNPALALEGLSTEPTAGFMKSVLNSQRQEKMINALRNWTYTNSGCQTPQQVTLSSNIDGAKLQVNGLVVPTNRFSGTLFAPIVLKASAPEGYTFKGWQDANGNIFSTDEEYNISYQGDFTMTAVYEPVSGDNDLVAAIAMPVKVNELSAGNTVFVSDQWKRSDWIELYNNTDEPLNLAGLFVSDDIDQPLKFQIQDGLGNTVVPARGHFIVWADGLKTVTGSTQQHASFKLSNADNQMVLVSSSDDFVANNTAYFNQHPEMRSFVDGMTYTAHRGDQTVGRYPDGGYDFYKMWRPTIERTNTLLISDVKVGEDRSLMSLFADGFALELAQGWTWTSLPLYSPVSSKELPSEVNRVVGQKKESVRTNTGELMGTLTSLEAGNMYKIQARADVVYRSDGSFCNGRMPVMLQPGWNWVGYPVNGTQPLTTALADFLAENGDQMIGQDGFATYNDGKWTGTLSCLETGKGYMLFTRQAKTLTFCTPQVSVNLSRGSMRSPAAQHYGIDKHAYPNVMGIIAQLVSPTISDLSSQFTLLAYSVDGECRGVGQWIGEQAFLTVYGQGGEELVYRLVDNIDGTVYSICETDQFASGVLGSMSQPRLLTIGDPTGETSQLGDMAAASRTLSPIVGYYTLSGIQVIRHADALTPGTYVVRYADGTHRKMQIQ